MAQEGFKRKLTAIFSADVIGYTRLMRDDEEATVRDLDAHRILITEFIQKHHGQVVDSPADNILAEFAIVVDGLNGAIKIQEEIEKINTDVPGDRRMEFRIGIDLGDVIEEDERIYGDGVNIAACRLPARNSNKLVVLSEQVARTKNLRNSACVCG